MIETHSLRKSYGDLCAVKDITLKVPAGEVLGLLGVNGAGKTTTIRMLTTAIPPSGGRGTVAGFDIVKEGAKVRSNLGYLPENPPLYPEMRVGEYLRFVGKIRGVGRAELRSAVTEVLERCSLTQVERRLCGELSKGYRQRVGIAQAILHKPAVIILDEPTNGLDPTQIVEVRGLIRALQRKHTVVLSTHILREVAEVCTSFAVLARGAVVDQGSLSGGGSEGEGWSREKELERRFLTAVSEGAGEGAVRKEAARESLVVGVE